VVVSSVKPKSPAAVVGVMGGDVLLAVDKTLLPYAVAGHLPRELAQLLRYGGDEYTTLSLARALPLADTYDGTPDSVAEDTNIGVAKADGNAAIRDGDARTRRNYPGGTAVLADSDNVGDVTSSGVGSDVATVLAADQESVRLRPPAAPMVRAHEYAHPDTKIHPGSQSPALDGSAHNTPLERLFRSLGPTIRAHVEPILTEHMLDVPSLLSATTDDLLAVGLKLGPIVRIKAALAEASDGVRRRRGAEETQR
jgi:hypothetical protein